MNIVESRVILLDEVVGDIYEEILAKLFFSASLVY